MAAHKYAEHIEVSALVYPQAFRWRGKAYEVIRVLRRWRQRGSWWDGDPGRAGAQRECWRVEARAPETSGVHVVDLARDLATDGWQLDRVWD